MSKLITKYALILFLALSGLKFLEYQFFSYKMTLEIYLGIIASVFLVAGILIAKYWFQLREKQPSIQHLNNHEFGQPTSTSIDKKRLEQFSGREQQVLRLLCHGYTNKEIAKSLDISPNTVKTHLSKLFSKLGVSNRTQALSEAKLLKIIN